MILRKPYAFLIKHFQKINLALLLLASFVIYKHLTFLGMTREYIATKYYSPIASPMSSFASFSLYFAIAAIIIICGILIYLLYYKKKPVIVYGLIILEYLAVIFAFSFGASYFNEVGFNVINLQQALLVRDILFIVSLPQYIILIILAIRSLGLDLKKFGFREDEEYLDINEEDREEFEVEVGFDINNVKRTVRQKLRFLKYFILEYKVILLIIVGVLGLVGGYFGYKYGYVENRVYQMGEVFSANSYQLKINRMYFTDKDFAGNVINAEGRKYIVLDFNVTNMTNEVLTLDTGKFILTANRRYYVPIQTHNQYFTDLGKGYQNQSLKPKEEYNYLLIYEIKPEDFGSIYTLFYQEVLGANKLKLRQINTSLTDLSMYDEIVEKEIGQPLEIDFYDEATTKFTITSYQIANNINYLYTSCYVWDCRVYEGNIDSSLYSGNSSVLKISYSGDQIGLTLSNFFVKQAKIIYMVDGEEKKAPLRLPLSREWKGKYTYHLVPKEVETSSIVKLEFVVRDKAYHYILKGGEAN